MNAHVLFLIDTLGVNDTMLDATVTPLPVPHSSQLYLLLTQKLQLLP